MRGQAGLLINKFSHGACVQDAGLRALLLCPEEDPGLEGPTPFFRFDIVYRQSPVGPVDPSFRALSGRL